ncbi:mannose-1-phosphate guanylyltransferase [Candidatus Peregrinibacteria bacterium HGW-Peregrinibacteria-1]|jgi:mannose-1-phosphate guanylyltransferase|nr:MAG: mannose-1-phosphate guanylyltransferase [Candidatus Peregrinibacteria bacterium HGW-Peregrinibacteria-1]
MKAVILAGGGGTRLWPLSTLKKPKQFQKLVSEKTMLQETIERLDFLDITDIFIAVNEEHLTYINQICPQIPKENILLEPALRDTASCIGYAAAVVEHRHPGEVMAVIYADHLIQDKQEFQEKLKIAEAISLQDNTLNIIEVTAQTPNTNYGYVKLGPLQNTINGSEVYQLDSFKEKPDLETAKRFVADGNYLWNTGIYVWQTKTLLKHYENLAPETYQKIQKIISAPELLNEIYPTLEKISLDYAIMEKIDPSEVRIIKATLGWSDIGNWEAIWHELPKQDHDNVTRGDIALLDVNSSIIYNDQPTPVKIIGLDNIVVINTPEGLFISDKKQSARIKELL